jgi:hypothetical protein
MAQMSRVFVGRGQVVAALHAAVDAALTGVPQLVLLAGEPGIGKTALVGQASGYAARRGARVGWGACWDGDGVPAFWPWAQVLRGLPGSDGAVRAAIGTVYRAGTAWVVEHWTRRLGRPPADHELEPLTRAYLQAGQKIDAGRYLLAIEDLQAFARTVAGFLTGVDMWLTPTLAQPPVPLGLIVSTDDDPYRAEAATGAFVPYPAVVANITGGPAMSVPLYRSPTGLPIGVHLLGRYGDDAGLFRLAGQLEQARDWTRHRPPIFGIPAGRRH